MILFNFLVNLLSITLSYSHDRLLGKNFLAYGNSWKKILRQVHQLLIRR